MQNLFTLKPMKQLLFSLTILAFCLASTSALSQDRIKTNGLSEYWDPDEEQFFKIFKKEFWEAKRLDHLEEVGDMVLMVRLKSEEKRLKILRDRGKNKAAAKLEEKARVFNEAVVSSMQENYKGGPYYFYYQKDAGAIFQNKDFTKLYTNLESPAQNVTIETAAYVLQYNTAPGQTDKKFHLHLWDKDASIYRIKNHGYISYEEILSSKKDIYRSIKIFCDAVALRN